MIASGLMILAVSCLCIIIGGIAEAVDLRRRITVLERKEKRRKTAERLQKIKDRRKR